MRQERGKEELTMSRAELLKKSGLSRSRRTRSVVGRSLDPRWRSPYTAQGLLCVLSVLAASRPAAAQRPDIVWMAGGHSGPVTSVVYSPDGQMCASGSWDNTIKIWRVSDRMLLRTLAGAVYNGWGSIAVSPDGETLASAAGAEDCGRTSLWRVSDGAELWTVYEPCEPRPNSVSSIAFSPDGQILASAVNEYYPCWTSHIKPRRVSDGTVLTTIDPDWVPRSITSVAFSPDGQVLASGGVIGCPAIPWPFEGEIRFWRVSDGQLLRTLTGDAGGLSPIV